jgi:hypothetical protein
VGAHGRRIYDWARVGVRPCHREDCRPWVIARRSFSQHDEIAYCPADTTPEQLIRRAGSRWPVKECFQTAKQERGLHDYQVRRYPGRHRHMDLPMAAHACLTVLRARPLDTEKAEEERGVEETDRTALGEGVEYQDRSAATMVLCGPRRCFSAGRGCAPRARQARCPR